MNCKICNTETEVQFNIKKQLIPVCDKCSTAIFLQQSKFYAASKSIFDLPQTYKVAPLRHPEITAEILNFLNEKLKKKKRYTPDNIPDVFLQLVSARVEEGHSLLKMKAVVHSKFHEWIGDDVMRKHIRPSTLFNKLKFNTYVTEIPEHYNPDNNKVQRDLIRKLNHLGVSGNITKETDTLAKELQATGYTKKRFLNMYLIKKL